MVTNQDIQQAMHIRLDDVFDNMPEAPVFETGIRRAPRRNIRLSRDETILALKNALRYVPPAWHAALAPEFLEELQTRGRIYGYRFRPHGPIQGRAIGNYRGRCTEGKAFQEELTREQTLVMASGHPLGLFASNPGAPRVVITNGLMVGEFDNAEQWNRAAALGVANYGQMTAGGWMYIGPQGIVHGTYSMSGAQGKAIEISGGVGIIAEVDESRIQTRHAQGWVSEVVTNPADAFQLARTCQTSKTPTAIAFKGNVIDLLEYAVENQETIDLLSDQTSCHVVYDGGYCPQGLTFQERTELLKTDHARFVDRVNISLKRHFDLIRQLVDRGTYFFDYVNSFLKAIADAGVLRVCRNGRDSLDGFIYPSYVEDLMGPLLFDYGYGPFRWVCLSGRPEDLAATDQAAMDCIDPERRFQDRDNYNWIRDAGQNQLVVGTQARILYQDAEGRTRIALKFNDMVRSGTIGPVMLGRDHHDTGGTDSPYRETANIYDGSNVMADMATHCFAGNAARGMSLVALHNGGGVGIGKAVNGGFGLVLDGSQRVDAIIRQAMPWDVLGGVARRAWARNPNALETIAAHNHQAEGRDHVTLPYLADEKLITDLVDHALESS